MIISKRKIYIVSQPHYLQPFADFFEEVGSIEESDIVMFTGGEDVSPSLYCEKHIGSRTCHNVHRDIMEVEYFEWAKALGKKFLGICRGSQFLTVMAGGQLIQDVTHHGLVGGHLMYTTHPDFDTVVMSSTHHQMMYPSILDERHYKLLAWTDGRSKHYLNGKDEPIPHSRIEPEVVWYPRIQALAIQGHPEIMDKGSGGVKYARELVKEYLL